jgi:hypothetical protein
VSSVLRPGNCIFGLKQPLLGAFVSAEIARWGKVVKDAGVKIE